jgi:hypothetical protein
MAATNRAAVLTVGGARSASKAAALYEVAHHGMCATNAETINADLFAFIRLQAIANV